MDKVRPYKVNKRFYCNKCDKELELLKPCCDNCNTGLEWDGHVTQGSVCHDHALFRDDKDGSYAAAKRGDLHFFEKKRIKEVETVGVFNMLPIKGNLHIYGFDIPELYDEVLELRNRLSVDGIQEIFEEDHLLLDRVLNLFEALGGK